MSSKYKKHLESLPFGLFFCAIMGYLIWIYSQDLDSLIEDHDLEVREKLALIPKACDSLKQDRKLLAQRSPQPHDVLVGYRGEYLEAHNTLFASARNCPYMRYSDDKTFCLDQSCFELGFSHFIGSLAAVFIDKNERAKRTFYRTTHTMSRDINALKSLKYLLLYTIDEFKKPSIHSAKKQFWGGRFKGRFFLYRLSDTRLLASTSVDVQNAETIDVGMTGYQEIEYIDELGNEMEETVDLGSWHDKAPGALISQLENRAIAHLAKVLDYRNAKPK